MTKPDPVGGIRNPYFISSPDESVSALRERFADMGYLFFPQAVAATLCQWLLDTILDQLHPYITPDTESSGPTLAGEPFFETDPVWDEVYPRVQRL